MILHAGLHRVLRGVRRWRGEGAGQPIPVDPELPASDWRHLATEIEATVENKGGPVAARRRAGKIGVTYESLTPGGRLRFFQKLAEDFGHEDQQVNRAMDAVFAASTREARRSAEDELRRRLRARREVLLRRLAGLDDGLPFLIGMRSELLPHRRRSPELTALDGEMRQILEEWFDVGFLNLERLTWDTPASFLEKLIEYEAVHAIESWDDLKRRLGPGRRCYAFLHPGMPDDPLIFVEVALTKDIARSLEPLLAAPTDPDHAAHAERDSDTAIFYSISNCHDGLAGVSLGDFLIKSVVEELAAEMPGLKTFATLSPMPGFRSWLVARADGDGALLTPEETAALGDGGAGIAEELDGLIAGPPRPPDDPLLSRVEPVLLRLAATYLLETGPSGRAVDPVAHFHLTNGARVEYVNWMANPSPVGWDRGLGLMVNYRYDLRTIETNHDRYISDGRIAAADAVRKLAEPPKADGGRIRRS